MNSLSLRSVKVNDGDIRNSEIPLWVGTSQVAGAIYDRRCTMSITVDRDWLWVRFNQTPSEKFRRALENHGFIFSKRCLAWHAENSNMVCKLLASWGQLV